MKMRQSCIALAVALCVASCDAPSEIGNGPKTITTDGKVAALTSADESIASLAVETLAEDLNIPIGTIEIDSVRAVEWRDSSIGCPEAGQAYMQVITPGHKVTLRVDGELHFVHEANGRAAVCRQAKINPGQLPQIDLVWGRMAVLARADLAKKLGVEENLILINGASGMQWDSAALGCEEPGISYAAGVYDGFILNLRHGTRTYTYHTDLDQVIACPAILED